MIKKINIKDFAIIDDINIDFNPGLTVITGETGSGKSIILESIASLINGKFSKSAIKHGFSVSFPEWKDCKDASDALTKYGRLYTIKSIINSKEKNPTKIELLMRKVCKCCIFSKISIFFT